MSHWPDKKQIRRNVLRVDASRCIGCQSCAVACKLEHDLPAGPLLFKIIQLGPVDTGDGLLMHFMPVTCFHCDRPACVPACPTGAMQKRVDGLVFSDPELCIGCQSCAAACPFGLPQLNPATGKITKCDGCKERVDRGLWPSCALTCPAGALTFGQPSDVIREARQQEAVRIVRTLNAEGAK